MSIEKSLYQAPAGLADLADQEPDIEIEIEDPDALRVSVDGEEILEFEKGLGVDILTLKTFGRLFGGKSTIWATKISKDLVTLNVNKK
jgi:hypothetical protein